MQHQQPYQHKPSREFDNDIDTVGGKSHPYSSSQQAIDVPSSIESFYHESKAELNSAELSEACASRNSSGTSHVQASNGQKADESKSVEIALEKAIGNVQAMLVRVMGSVGSQSRYFENECNNWVPKLCSTTHPRPTVLESFGVSPGTLLLLRKSLSQSELDASLGISNRSTFDPNFDLRSSSVIFPRRHMPLLKRSHGAQRLRFSIDDNVGLSNESNRTNQTVSSSGQKPKNLYGVGHKLHNEENMTAGPPRSTSATTKNTKAKIVHRHGKRCWRS